MKRLTFMCCMLLALGVLSLRGQTSISQYQGMKSIGEYPKYIANALHNAKGETQTFLRQELEKGNLIYGTLLNTYVDRVVDNLVGEDLVFRSKVHVYILRSAEVNAFATPQNEVFVNLGLLAQVSNESELAFVLAHELSHIALEHKYNSESYYRHLDKAEGLKQWLEFQNELRAYESAADRMAIEKYYRQSSYSYAALSGVFDVLQYSDLPFSEVPFTREAVETPCFQFSDKCFLASVQPVTNRDDRLDTLNSHPNIVKRRTAASYLVSQLSNEGRSLFVQPESLFNEVRTLARFACIEVFLTNHEYDKAIYNTYVMKQNFPDNLFLEEAMASAWYGLSMHKAYSIGMDDVVQPYKDVEGEMQQVCYFISKLSRADLSVLALRNLWIACKHQPENELLKTMCQDAMEQVFVHQKMKHATFSDYPMGTNPDSINESVATTENVDNKYERIRQQNVKIKPMANFKTFNYMLCDIRSDSSFVSMANRVIAAAEDQEVLKLIANGTNSRKFESSNSLLVNKADVYIYSDKETYSERLRNKTKAEKLSQRVTRTMFSSAKNLKLSPIGYERADLAAFKTEDYNSYCTLRQWETEFFAYKAGCPKVILYQNKYLEDVYGTLGTNKYAYAFVTRQPDSFMDGLKWSSIWLAAACPVVLPAMLADFAMPRYQTKVACGVVDMETGEILSSKYFNDDSKCSKAYIDATIYNTLYDYKKGGQK